MTVAFYYSAFWISTEVVYLQRCLVVTWLVPRGTAAVSMRSVYTIQPCIISHYFMQNHIRIQDACVFSCKDLSPALLAEWPGSFTCYCGNKGSGTDTEVRVSTESWPWRIKLPPLLPGHFDHESGASLTTELTPLTARWTCTDTAENHVWMACRLTALD